ncbi:MAG: aspartate carbamoyltransferase catalytic subunit [Mycoplasmataceae bacterium]|nr:aspartate carbamoyltransferase catalytic subunit [Mycoplasmataceae bacterium]
MSNSLLKLSNISVEEIQDILKRAEAYANGLTSNLSNKIIANLFFESSTRTHYSFITAEHKLNCKILDFSPAASSLVKGETFYDTVKTFVEFGVDAIVIRSDKNQWYKELENINIPLINAGDGTLDHPSQTLLDLLTIRQEFHKFKGVTVLIVGDILHSRVAHSNIQTMKRLGIKVLLSAPKEFQDSKYQYVDFDKGLLQADVVNMLRIQTERLQQKMSLSIVAYRKKYGLNKERLSKMKNKAIIIHPAPVNRNVEIDDDIVECHKSRIFKQIKNGVFVRMAIIERAVKK